MEFQEVKRIAEAVGKDLILGSTHGFYFGNPPSRFYSTLAPIKRLLAEELLKRVKAVQDANVAEKEALIACREAINGSVAWSERYDNVDNCRALATRLEASASEDEKPEPTTVEKLRIERDRPLDLCQLEQLILDALIEFGERIEKLEGKG